jgi:ech hydrogenase subunit D
MQGEVIPVSLDHLIGETGRLKAEGYRFVTASCVELDEKTVDILYHFDRDLKLTHLRLTISREILVPSVSSVYLAAFLVENEIQDLFGVRFKGLAVDYNRTLYLDEEIKTAPLCKYTVGKAKPENPDLTMVHGS